MSKDEKHILSLLKSSAGNTKAFELIVDHYQEKLYRHIRHILVSHDDANDVLQNTFIKIWKGLPSYRGDARIYTWLYRIATNEALTFLKKEKKRLENISGEDAYFNLKSSSYFDGDLAEKRFLMAVARLPDKQKAVFQLKYFEEMKYRDMAEVFNTSVGALKASYHHAVKKIRENLEMN